MSMFVIAKVEIMEPHLKFLVFVSTFAQWFKDYLPIFDSKPVKKILNILVQ